MLFQKAIALIFLGIGFDDLTLTQNGDDSAIAVEGKDVAILSSINADALTESNARVCLNVFARLCFCRFNLAS